MASGSEGNRWPGWLTPAIAVAAFGIIAWAERRWPLRERREPARRRLARNLATAALTAAITSSLQKPLLDPLVRTVDRRRLGLLNQLGMPPLVRTAMGVLMLDYTLWWWHFANHRSAFLWRFHLVHHADRDLDVSTAVRFHFGEMALSVFLRMAQVRLLGVSPIAISLFQTMLFVSIFFHHSNLRLEAETERSLVRWVVTPRMHGIHHSDDREETDSNWSSLFSWWDRMHGTLRLDVPQEEIRIGVPAYQRPDDVTLGKMIVAPFLRQRNDWDRPEDRTSLADESGWSGA